LKHEPRMRGLSGAEKIEHLKKRATWLQWESQRAADRGETSVAKIYRKRMHQTLDRLKKAEAE
jgi:hypothetical protein